MVRPLTRKQRRVVDTIRTFIEENGYSPSVRELGDALGLAPATIQQHLDALQGKGFINRTGAAYGITLEDETPQAGQSYTTTVIGTIAAGEPILAFEEYEDRIAAPQAMLEGGEHFALRVQGDSMIEDHILNGDLVVIPPSAGRRRRRRGRGLARRRHGDSQAALPRVGRIPAPAGELAAKSHLRR